MKNKFLANRVKARKLGIGLMDELNWESEQLGLTDSQKVQLSDALSDVIHSLIIGSLDIAKIKLEAISPIPVIFEQTRINRYVSMLDDLINIT